jgi:hypothetical protein
VVYLNIKCKYKYHLQRNHLRVFGCKEIDIEAHLAGGSGQKRSKRRIGQWSDEALEKAINAITDDRMKLNVTSKMFEIPTSSLRDDLYTKTTSRQRDKSPTLKPDEEDKLVDYVIKMQELRHPLTPIELRLKVALAIQYRKTLWSATGVLGND